MRFMKLTLIILSLCFSVMIVLMVVSGVAYAYRVKISETNITLYYLSFPIQHLYVLSERAEENSRIGKLFEMVKVKGGVEKEVEILTYIPLFTVSHYSPGDGVYPPTPSRPGYKIRLNKKLTRLSDEALLGAIAHELGHITQGHLDERWFLPLKDMQDEADEWAAGVVGRDAVVAYIRELDRKNRKILPTSFAKPKRPAPGLCC